MSKNKNYLNLKVELGDRSYDILIGDGLLADVGSIINAEVSGAEHVCVITDENVNSIYGEALGTALKGAGISYDVFVIPPGEGSKNIELLSEIYDYFGEDGRLSRKGTVIAFGGGVVGDLAGFAASTWMRGVRFINIPTTLLAQVDSSVGGKTAIDTPRGKNLVGSFYQPSLVIIDPRLLVTLPEREYRAGMAEVIKYGAIASEGLFVKLEGTASVNLPDVIYECLRIKSDIVSEDERDTGRRAILNFGHSFGHAIETKYDFEKYNHGEAVAIGMSIATWIGEAIGITEPRTAVRLDKLLRKYELFELGDARSLIPLLKHDKKSDDEAVDFVLIEKVGQVTTKRILYAELEELIQ